MITDPSADLWTALIQWGCLCAAAIVGWWARGRHEKDKDR